MSGDLSETPAADLCRGLAARGASGGLELDGPDGPGRIVFVDGRVVAATSPTPRGRLGDRLVGAGLLDDDALAGALHSQSQAPEHTRLGALLVEEGLVSHDAVRLFVQEQVIDALFDILRWRYGTYRFLEGEPAGIPEVPLSIAVDEVLVEIARRQHEWDELSRVIPDLEAVPTFRSSGSTTNAALEPDEFAVLASVDGHRSIRELASDLGYGEFEAARIIYGLSLLGVVDVRLPEDEVGAALDDALAYDEDGEPAEELPPLTGRAPSATGDDDVEDQGTVIEADLPPPAGDFGAILTPRTDRDDAPADPPAAAETPPPAVPPPQPAADTPPAGDRPAPSGDHREVSEFLRELSRLAIDDAPEPPSRPSPPRPPEPDEANEGAPDESRDDSKRKRRGLFGRG